MQTWSSTGGSFSCRCSQVESEPHHENSTTTTATTTTNQINLILQRDSNKLKSVIRSTRGLTPADSHPQTHTRRLTPADSRPRLAN
jgi:hypothetical protein